MMANSYLFFFSLILLMTILASINCNGLRCPDKRKMAFSFFKRNRFDIIFLQETHWTVDLDMQIKREWEGDAFFAHGTNSSRGVAILIASRLDYNEKQIRRDNEGRVLNMLLEIDDRTLNLINVYSPSKDSQRRAFFSDLNRFLSDSNDNILGGDFNCIFNSRLDKLGGVPNARQSASVLLNALNTRFSLVDVWRERHKNERNFTWTGRDPRDPSLFIRTY